MAGLDAPKSGRKETDSVDFRNWSDQLDAVELDSEFTRQIRSAIMVFLGACKRERRPATIAFAREFLARNDARKQGEVHSISRLALRWFVMGGGYDLSGRCGRRPSVRRDPGTPPPLAATDLGRADWERALITAIRRRGLLWRTEQTYPRRKWVRHRMPDIGLRFPW